MVPSQFYLHDVSGLIAKIDLKQNKGEKSDLGNANGGTNTADTQDSTNYNPGHPKICKKMVF